jgi:hypothetical protein
MLNLTCCCCGEPAPAIEQWRNRDFGYGLCGKCAADIKTGKLGNGMTDEEFTLCYGLEGRHWLALSTLNPQPSTR